MRTDSYTSAVKSIGDKEEIRKNIRTIALICAESDNEKVVDYCTSLLKNELIYFFRLYFNEKFETTMEDWSNYLDKSIIRYLEKALEQR